MAKKRQKKKEQTNPRDNYVFVYADIETYSPEIDPHFWIGGMKIDDEYVAYDKFEDFFNALIKPIKGKKKVIVFHNSSYDLGILKHHASKYYNYQINPKKNGQKYSFYDGQFCEIYSESNVNPVFVIDSKPLLPGSLGTYGSIVGLEKGDTPIAKEYRRPTEEDYKYLENDVEMLARAFKLFGHEEHVAIGQLTISSVSYNLIKSDYHNRLGKKNHTNALKRKHSASESEKDWLPLPSYVSKAIEDECRDFFIREKVYSIETKKPLYGISMDVVEQYKSKLRKYYSAKLSEEVNNFSRLQKEVAKQLKLRDANKDYDNDLLNDFFSLTVDDSDMPKGKNLVDSHHYKRILETTNSYIAPAMRGGMTYVNPNHVTKETGRGGVIDVNSLYPFVLSNYKIPSKYVGSTNGIEPDYDKYYVAQILYLKASVKKGRHPFLKRSTSFTTDKVYKENIEWSSVKKGKKSKSKSVINTALCSVDIDWLYENYDVEKIEYGHVFYFEEEPEFLEAVNEHIKHWRAKKENAKTPVDKLFAKMMLNTIWGRWGMFEKDVDDAGETIDIGDKDTNYVSAIYTTAYARVYLNKMMNWFEDDLLYTDTDSVHFMFNEKVKDLEDLKVKLGGLIDSKEFGMWDFEKEFDNAKYMKAKTYAMKLKDTDKIKTVTAGRSLPTLQSLDEFYLTATFDVKENQKLDDGRTIIYKSFYTLK